jgi:5-formyltetrahydrofolate cyclo-ligase
MPGWSLVEEKRALRRLMRAERERVAPSERGRMAHAASRALLGLPEMAGAKILSAYVPTRCEMDVSEVVADRTAAGATAVYPRVGVGRPRLRFHVVTGDTALAPGAFGILEPLADEVEVPPEKIDVLLVPGLAFDASGRRLGYGGGYYDEIAGKLRAAGRGFLVGVGYDFQLIEHCPTGDGDATMDCIVTDARVVRCERKQPGG